MSLRLAALVAAALHVAACSSPPRPLPGGPPPEYEPPRAFDAGPAAPSAAPPETPPVAPSAPPAEPAAPPADAD